MEIIKNYLDSMFSTLPDIPEVRKAREELYQMMEDKYHELKSEGRSENEAVGIVITEFGNLDELKEELGISYTNIEESNPKAAQERYVSISQAKEYLGMMEKYSIFIAVATMLCIISPVAMIFLGGLSEITAFGENAAGFGGITILFGSIIVAVAIFIYAGNQLEDYEYLKKEIFRLDKSTEIYLQEEKKKKKSTFTIRIIIGVVLCIFSVLPLLWSAFLLNENDFACIVSVCILLIIVGIAVAILIHAGMQQESYKVLLQEGDYKKSNKDKGLETIATVYWCIVTAIYLGWSFWTFQWNITWIIWPIAGVLYGAIAAIYNAVWKNNEFTKM